MAAVTLSNSERAYIDSLVCRLSPEEKEVIDLVIAGKKSKTIAKQQGVALRTIEERRARVMRKLHVKTLPDLIKVWLAHTGHFRLAGYQSEIPELNEFRSIE